MPKSADAIVVGLATINGGETAAVGVGADLDKKYESAYGRGVMAMATALGASASADSVTVLPALEGSRLVVVGLEDADVTPERLRRATGNALRSIAAMEGADGWEVAVSLEVTDPELVQATAEGATYDEEGLLRLLRLPRIGCAEIFAAQAKAEARGRGAVVAPPPPVDLEPEVVQ